MVKTQLSQSHAWGEFSTLNLMHRHIGAIAVLILISLLSSWSGTPVDHAVSNPWEGFLWGLADPVISLDCLTGIIAIGLLSSAFVRGAAIAGCFVLAVILGIVIHSFQLNLPAGTEIAIAISTIVFGTMLMLPNQPNFIVLALVGVSAGLFQGYADAESIIGAGTMPLIAYILGISLTLFTVAMSAREIGSAMGMGEVNRILPWKITIAGFAFCAIGIVFLSNSMI